MAILDTPTKSLRIVLGEAKGTLDCDILAFWGAQTSTGFVPVANDLVSNGTTAVTVVPAPGAGEQRQVNEVRLFNNDTITHNVTLQFDNGGTIRVIEAAPVLAGGEFLYTPSSTNAASGGGGSAEWNAGTVNAISGNLAISSDTLDLANSFSISGTATSAISVQGQVQRSTVTAGSGDVGEYISQSVTSGSAVSLTTGSVAAIGSIVIAGTGDFDLYGMIALTGTTTTTVTQAQASINTVGTTLGATLGLFSNMNFGGVALGGEDLSMNIIGARVTAAGTYFLNTKVTFAIGTLAAYGLIEARRR